MYGEQPSAYAAAGAPDTSSDAVQGFPPPPSSASDTARTPNSFRAGQMSDSPRPYLAQDFRTHGIQKAYDAFLADERRYMAEANWKSSPRDLGYSLVCPLRPDPPVDIASRLMCEPREPVSGESLQERTSSTSSTSMAVWRRYPQERVRLCPVPYRCRSRFSNEKSSGYRGQGSQNPYVSPLPCLPSRVSPPVSPLPCLPSRVSPPAIGMLRLLTPA